MRLLSVSMTLGLLLSACSGDGLSPTPETGTMQLPLIATGSTGTDYRLSPARFRVVGTDFNRVYDASELDLLRVNLDPGNYTIQLLGNWVLNEDDGVGGLTPVEAVLQSPNPQDFTILVGEHSDVVFLFGVGDDKIAFGQGQVRVSIDVNDCTPSPEICNGEDDDCNGLVDDSPECIPEICDNLSDDDGDGDTDCDDAECAAEPICTVPPVGTTGNDGVLAGADWEVCRADQMSAWVSGQDGGGTYDTTVVCQALGYDGADVFGGNCNEVCGYCGTPGQETYDGAGLGFPDMYRQTVNFRCVKGFVPPPVGLTGGDGVLAGADWQVCRSNEASAWVSGGDGGGTYDTTAVCQSLGYDNADFFGGNCNEVCGYCGTPGLEMYDGAGLGFPDMYRQTVNFRCVRTP